MDYLRDALFASPKVTIHKIDFSKTSIQPIQESRPYIKGLNHPISPPKWVQIFLPLMFVTCLRFSPPFPSLSRFRNKQAHEEDHISGVHCPCEGFAWFYPFEVYKFTENYEPQFIFVDCSLFLQLKTLGTTS
ncbi:hypothetical protein Ccrd_024046 [Cynara cardunculus var. scolymus]|uniref:Uncharacterized protein n=1 Tax=Cynara cardunculus var. scolymus TaxID=59895 RepID=A0A118DKW2_CYNCS|nr:hypothetical protein Ccrd_024046 [Cynara cardunculus var. scolymus]